MRNGAAFLVQFVRNTVVFEQVLQWFTEYFWYNGKHCRKHCSFRTTAGLAEVARPYQQCVETDSRKRKRMIDRTCRGVVGVEHSGVCPVFFLVSAMTLCFMSS
jgi:hypothetical protein